MMEQLKRLLDLGEEGMEKPESRFEEIANDLFHHYHIRKSKDTYDFLEIEFYYYTGKHKDVITYRRTSPPGYWFFHQSGVDITFASEEGKSYGGILIRSLLKNGETVIAGPLKCKRDLFDRFDAFEEKGEFPLIEKKKETTPKQIIQTQRWIRLDEHKARRRFLNEYDSFEQFRTAPYRFFVKEIKHPI
ncbi:MAG: hypothetical protein LBS05_02890 [Tannerellaceae bacterium]|jgi:hypothetical protein|nr:hypothetical protein [Tannerellaceae bacterium]